MTIAIVGSGAIGGALGTLWARAGHAVVFASRHPDRLTDLAERAGPSARAGPVEEAVRAADVVLEAVPYHAALGLDPEALAGKTVLSASNYYPARDGPLDLGGRTETGAVAARLPDTAVVKAFNMMPATVMDRHVAGRPSGLAVLLAGDDPGALGLAETLVRDAGFTPVVTGDLASGRLFEPGTPLYGARATAAEARAWLDGESS